MKITIHLTPTELRLAKEYASRHSLTIEDAFKSALFEQIEDEYDNIIADEAYAAYLSDSKTYTHEEVRTILRLS